MEDEPSLMTTEIMLGRMRDYGIIGVSQTASVIMGGVFATAAVTFIDILQSREALLVRVTGWMVGAIGSLQVFDSLVRRSLLEGRPTFHAIPLIGAAGLISMIGFALLGPQAGGADGWRYSQLVVLLAGILFSRSWGASLADYVEPAVQGIYQRHAERTRQRWRLAWPFILGAVVPFGLAMADKYAHIPLQWPIAIANLVLCAFYLLSMLRAHRYMTSVYELAFKAHVRKLDARQSS
jgi:hypothetical protein